MSANPERIYNWLDSQLSIARHYGAINYNGSHYVIDYLTEGRPLVREDVMRREAKERQAKESAERKARKQKQQVMI